MSAIVTLREITAATVRQVVALDVSEPQRSYVAPNAASIAEAHFNPGAWFRCVCADDIPVGFVMLFNPAAPGAIARPQIEPADVALWRLMIRHSQQGQGYGRGVLDLIRGHIRNSTGASRIISSYVPGPDGPEGFYLRYGFQKTGRMRPNGTEVEIWMAP